MARQLQPCGTPAAYKRHLRNKETPCEPCKAAAREQKNSRAEAARAESGTAVAAAVQSLIPEVEIDPLEEARDNLRIIRAALNSSPPHNSVAALTRRREEVVALILELEAERGEVDAIDAIISDIASYSARKPGS